MVYFINEGVGPTLNFTGLHVVTIRTTNLTFNIYNYYNGKHLLSWQHSHLRRSGSVGPLVFLEIGRRCHGGPGLLWMYHPTDLAAAFRESLQRLVVSIIVRLQNTGVYGIWRPWAVVPKQSKVTTKGLGVSKFHSPLYFEV